MADKNTRVSNIHWTQWEPYLTPEYKFTIEQMFHTGTFQYVVCSHEVCPTTDRNHWQCYAQLKGRKRMSQLIKMMPFASNIQPMHTTVEASAHYCNNPQKPGFVENIIDLGSPKEPGKRTDVEAVAERVTSGASLEEIATEFPAQYIKYHHGIKALQSSIRKPRRLRDMPLVIVHYGPTGSGKSHSAHEYSPDAYVWGPEMGKWWPGYDGQDEVIMEEFRGQMPFAALLRLIDRYKFEVEYKGGSTQMLAHTFQFTSPVHPAYWYPGLAAQEGRIDQLKRRITEIWKHTEPGVEPEVDDTWPDIEPGLLPGQSQFSDA